jgi:5-dehydro-4-deoxyglucarate dehydratase
MRINGRPDSAVVLSGFNEALVHFQALKQTVSSGLLSFPITDIDEVGGFHPGSYTKRLEWLVPYGAKALFVGGGTGEGFSLTPAEHEPLVCTE